MRKYYLLFSFLLYISTNSYSQEAFSVEFGQFFEQGYGLDLDEEGIDIGPFNSDKLLVGWQNVSENEAGVKDAIIWHIEERGKEQYSKLLGVSELDEVATGVIQVDAETYAVCVHQSEDWDHMDVKPNDETWVYLIQSGGTVLWSYNIPPSEEGGIAPSDIILDDNGDIVVLLNRLNARGTISNEIVSLNKLGTQNWASAPFAQSASGGWAFELLEHGGNFITLVNDLTLGIPFALEFTIGGTINNVVNFTNSTSDHLFGLDYDPVSSGILGAGYTVIEEDTNAYVAKLSIGLNLIADWNYGIAGTEKFIDIVSTGDGFVAGGVRSNKGEGKFDCYLHHLDGNLATYAEETMGGSTNERLNNLNMMQSATDVWFAGHNIEWSLAESGNAYLGGTTLGFSVSGANCEIPRVIMVDAILKPNTTTGSYNNGYSLGNSAHNQSVLSDIQRINGNIIVLYDIDRLLIDLEDGSLSASSQLVTFVEDFINQATSPPFNFTVGMVMGPSFAKLSTATSFLSATNGVSFWNYTRPSKLNFMMLEHEFWNMLDNADFRLLDQGTWSQKPVVINTNGGSAPPVTNIAHINGSYSQNMKNIFFHQAVKDHYFFLDELRVATDNSANNWKMFDYISTFQNRKDPADWGHPIVHYGGIDFNDPTMNISTKVISASQHRTNFADYSKTRADAIFLVYYRREVWVDDYDMGSATRPWVERMEALMTNSPNAPAHIIPLFSSELTGCKTGYWGNTGALRTSTKDFLGTWLGKNSGNNTLRLAESYYYSDHTNDFHSSVAATCPTCVTDINIVGMGWYQLECILDAEATNQTMSAAANGRINCGAIGGYLNDSSVKNEAELPSIYPNPSSGEVQFGGDLVDIEVNVYNQQGQLILRETLGIEKTIDLEDQPAGFYYISIPEKNLSWKLVLTK